MYIIFYIVRLVWSMTQLFGYNCVPFLTFYFAPCFRVWLSVHIFGGLWSMENTLKTCSTDSGLSQKAYKKTMALTWKDCVILCNQYFQDRGKLLTIRMSLLIQQTAENITSSNYKYIGFLTYTEITTLLFMGSYVSLHSNFFIMSGDSEKGWNKS